MGIPGVIYPPTLDFDYLVQRPQQLLLALSRLGVTVYFLNRPMADNAPFTGIQRYNEHLFLYNYCWPSYARTVKPVVYYSNPVQADKVGGYNHSLLVFDSLDWPEGEFSSWEPYYYRAVASANLVLAASVPLYEKAKIINPHTLLLPNGCDYDYFKQVRGKPLARPGDLPPLKGAVIGYMGAVAGWVDLELLAQVARAFPECSCLIIGPLYDVREVPRAPNIYWLGYKDYQDLAGYAGCFDVGIIPFKINAMTRAVNPVKMWEYLAMGIPVVTTDLPEAKRYGGLIYCSEGREEFINNIRLALRNETWQGCERRMRVARDNSWDSRGRQMLTAIEERLKGRNDTRESLPRPLTAVPYGRQPRRQTRKQVNYRGSAPNYKLNFSGGQPWLPS